MAAAKKYPAGQDASTNAKSNLIKHAKGECLIAVRMCFYLEPNGKEPDAYHGWLDAGGHDGANTHWGTWPAPPNVPVWWSGGSEGHGHVAISDHITPGMVWSTDIKRTGLFDLVPIELIHEKWGLTLLGWSETLEGHRVYPHKVT